MHGHVNNGIKKPTKPLAGRFASLPLFEIHQPARMRRIHASVRSVQAPLLMIHSEGRGSLPLIEIIIYCLITHKTYDCRAAGLQGKKSFA